MKTKSKKAVHCPEGIMPVKVDKQTIEIFGRVTNYGLKQRFPDTLFEKMYLTALRSLIIKLARALQRIRKSLTLQLSIYEVFCYRLTVQFWIESAPESLEAIVSQKYFPIPKQ